MSIRFKNINFILVLFITICFYSPVHAEIQGLANSDKTINKNKLRYGYYHVGKNIFITKDMKGYAAVSFCAHNVRANNNNVICSVWKEAKGLGSDDVLSFIGSDTSLFIFKSRFLAPPTVSACKAIRKGSYNTVSCSPWRKLRK